MISYSVKKLGAAVEPPPEEPHQTRKKTEWKTLMRTPPPMKLKTAAKRLVSN